MEYCPINWHGRRYPCCYYGGIGACKKLSGGCNPEHEKECREALIREGYTIESVNEVMRR